MTEVNASALLQEMLNKTKKSQQKISSFYSPVIILS